jgi:hypothetical protein
MFGMHGPAGNLPCGSIPGQIGHPCLTSTTTQTPLQMTVTQKMQELTNRACMDNFSMEDMNSLKVLKATLPTPDATITPEKADNISVQFCNIQSTAFPSLRDQWKMD